MEKTSSIWPNLYPSEIGFIGLKQKTLTENCQSRIVTAQSPRFDMAAIPGFQLVLPYRNC